TSRLLPSGVIAARSMSAATSGKLEAFAVDAASVAENSRQVAAAFKRDGLAVVRQILPPAVAEALCSRVDAELRARQSEGDDSYFGNVYGYEDAGQRWDLKLRLSPEVKEAMRALLECLQGVLEALRPSWQLTELAAWISVQEAHFGTAKLEMGVAASWLAEAMCTFPSDPGQPVHADTSHVYDQQVVTIFVALHDVPTERGPTKMYPRSHVDGELHLGMKEVDESSAVLCTLSCGDCV
ncbi:unnamed protein product, partial [Effrenium voratum]